MAFLALEPSLQMKSEVENDERVYVPCFREPGFQVIT